MPKARLSVRSLGDEVDAFTREHPVRRHGSAGDPPDAGRGAGGEDLCTLAGDPRVEQADGSLEAGQHGGRRGVQLPLHDAAVRRELPLQRTAADEIPFERAEADREPGQGRGEDGDLAALVIRAQLVAVQGECRLQPQRVAGSQPDRRGAEGEQAVPEPTRLAGGKEELEAQGVSGVAGAGDGEGNTADDRGAEIVAAGLGDQFLRLVLPGGCRLGDEREEDPPRLGALERDHGELFAAVGHVEPCDAPRLPVEELPVLLTVGGVDHEQEVFSAQAVQVRVVERSPGRRGDHGVLRPSGPQGGRVVRQDLLEQRQRAGAPEHEAPHVGDVEQSRVPPGAQVLVDDARGVLDGHFPAPELDHAGTEGNVAFVQWCAFHD